MWPPGLYPPGFSVPRIFQARILEWVANSLSRGSSQLRDWTWVFCTAGGFFTNWATREDLSVLKNGDIILPTKAHLVKAMVFPVVVYGCDSWTIKKAEHLRNDAFELWCWRRLLRVQGTERKSNQSVVKEIYPEYSLEGLMLRLKLKYLVTWCEELTPWKRPWYWERLKAGGEGLTENEMVGFHQRLDGHELE